MRRPAQKKFAHENRKYRFTRKNSESDYNIYNVNFICISLQYSNKPFIGKGKIVAQVFGSEILDKRKYICIIIQRQVLNSSIP